MLATEFDVATCEPTGLVLTFDPTANPMYYFALLDGRAHYGLTGRVIYARGKGYAITPISGGLTRRVLP